MFIKASFSINGNNHFPLQEAIFIWSSVRGMVSNSLNYNIFLVLLDHPYVLDYLLTFLLLIQTRMDDFSIRHMKADQLQEKSCRKLESTATSSRFNQTSKQQEEESKRNTTDLKAFQIQHKARLDEGFSCYQLMKVPYPISFVTSADLLKLQFSPLSYPIKDVIVYAKSIVQSSYERKIIGRSFNLLRLIQLIADKYHVRAYHNFTHAFSVLLMLYQSYSRSGRLQRMLTQKQWFYVFIAALMHDISHPGTNNVFQAKQESKLAVEAGNQSVLQKMHLSVFWKLVKSNSQINFLQGCPMMEAIEIKKLITRMVMATDAARHAQGVDNIKKLNVYRKGLKGQNALLLMEQVFHACDIGNPCLPFESYLNWSVLITYELDQIAVREQELGEKVTSYLKYEGLDKFYKGQVGFSEYLVLPLWRQLTLILPQLDEFVENIKTNIAELNAKISKLLS